MNHSQKFAHWVEITAWFLTYIYFGIAIYAYFYSDVAKWLLPLLFVSGPFCLGVMALNIHFTQRLIAGLRGRERLPSEEINIEWHEWVRLFKSSNQISMVLAWGTSLGIWLFFVVVAYKDSSSISGIYGFVSFLMSCTIVYAHAAKKFPGALNDQIKLPPNE